MKEKKVLQINIYNIMYFRITSKTTTICTIIKK